jgi:hypothetical protein
MMQSFQGVTVFEVEGRCRDWGAARDILMEYPSCQNRYLAVAAAVNGGTRVIWAPLESILKMDLRNKKIFIDSEIDEDLAGHLDRLEAPQNDVDELKLQRLYHRRPQWAQKHVAKDGTKNKYTLRQNSRMVRLSSLLDWTTVLRDGGQGKVVDMLLNPLNLQTVGFELEMAPDKARVYFRIDEGCPYELDQKQHVLYLDKD